MAIPTKLRRILAACGAVALLGMAMCLGIGAFALLVVFVEGPITPHSYSDSEKARNHVNGLWAAAGAIVSWGAAFGTLYWGFRTPLPRDPEHHNPR